MPDAPEDDRKEPANGWRDRLGSVLERLSIWWSGPAFRASTALMLVAIAIIAFLFLYVKPWGNPKEPNNVDIARAWSEQIARLGIIPLFPPQEDFHVGDVWAVIGRAESVPLQGKAVRIGHIDLRSEILRENGAPRFAETSLTEGKPAFIQPSQEEASEYLTGLITLSRVAFPNIVLHYSASSSTGFAFQPAGIGGRRSDIVSDEVRIPNAVTYGAPAPEAGAYLIGWCRNEVTSGYCTDGALLHKSREGIHLVNPA